MRPKLANQEAIKALKGALSNPFVSVPSLVIKDDNGMSCSAKLDGDKLVIEFIKSNAPRAIERVKLADLQAYSQTGVLMATPLQTRVLVARFLLGYKTATIYGKAPKEGANAPKLAVVNLSAVEGYVESTTASTTAKIKAMPAELLNVLNNDLPTNSNLKLANALNSIINYEGFLRVNVEGVIKEETEPLIIG